MARAWSTAPTGGSGGGITATGREAGAGSLIATPTTLFDGSMWTHRFSLCLSSDGRAPSFLSFQHPGLAGLVAPRPCDRVQFASSPQPVQAFMCWQNDPQQQSVNETVCSVANHSVNTTATALIAYLNENSHPYIQHHFSQRKRPGQSFLRLLLLQCPGAELERGAVPVAATGRTTGRRISDDSEPGRKSAARSRRGRHAAPTRSVGAITSRHQVANTADTSPKHTWVKALRRAPAEDRRP